MTKTEHLICVDPGIDGTGVAVYPDKPEARQGLRTAEDAAGALVELASIESDPKVSIEARAIEIAVALRRKVRYYGPARVVIEAPNYTGKYATHAAAGRSAASTDDGVAKLNRVIGALAMMGYDNADALEVIQPDGMPRALKRYFADVKKYRRAIVQEALRRAGRGKENLLGWGVRFELSNQDKIDAAYIGFRVLGVQLDLPQLPRPAVRA